MARKAVVDKDIILSMLKDGETTQRIADHFHVSRQAIDLHRKDFISRGILEDKRANRKKPVASIDRLIQSEQTGINHQPELILETQPFITDLESLSLDTHIDLLISAFSALKLLPDVEKELSLYKQENEKFKRELEKLKDREKKRIEQENRWMLIQDET